MRGATETTQYIKPAKEENTFFTWKSPNICLFFGECVWQQLFLFHLLIYAEDEFQERKMFVRLLQGKIFFRGNMLLFFPVLVGFLVSWHREIIIIIKQMQRHT